MTSILDHSLSFPSTPWEIKVLTLFPDMFPGPLGYSLCGKALKNNIWNLETVDLRNFSDNKSRRVDDTCFGGGVGMVIEANVIHEALNSVVTPNSVADKESIIYFSPRGQLLNQDLIRKFIKSPKINLICGRYEGIDERILKYRNIIEISIGDYVLSGGELAAQVFIDACVRLLPGVMGKQESMIEESFENGLLEYPHYTKPQIWKDMAVPEVLLSGHHLEIQKWRQKKSEEITKIRRPDLWDAYLKMKN